MTSEGCPMADEPVVMQLAAHSCKSPGGQPRQASQGAVPCMLVSAKAHRDALPARRVDGAAAAVSAPPAGRRVARAQLCLHSRQRHPLISTAFTACDAGSVSECADHRRRADVQDRRPAVRAGAWMRHARVGRCSGAGPLAGAAAVQC